MNLGTRECPGVVVLVKQRSWDQVQKLKQKPKRTDGTKGAGGRLRKIW